MTHPRQLKGITWDHSRGFLPLAATAQRYHELHPGVEIVWTKRSLQQFADQPLAEIALEYDLIVIDHPWAGWAAENGALVPMDEHLPHTFLDDQAANSVGRSHESYAYGGHQWALAIDAACPVAAYRRDLLENAGASVPETFDELIALGQRGLVCLPSIPLDVYGNFLNLCVAAGDTIFPDSERVTDRESGRIALDRLRQLTDVVPKEFFQMNPIQTLEAMSSCDRYAYTPYTYGYVNYTMRGYTERPLFFCEPVGICGGPGPTMLGGTGLAVTAGGRHVETALEYAMVVASERMQGGLFFQSGGQPGHRTAWEDPEVNYRSNNYFYDTLPALDRAFVRPRYAGYLEFQDRAGEPLHRYLREGGDAEKVLDAVDTLYAEFQRVHV